MYAFDYTHNHTTKKLGLVFKPCTQDIQSYDIEVKRAAKLNAEKGKNVIFLEGGIDSEICVRAMHAISADFTVITMAYNGWHNSTDIWYAQQCCKELGIEHTIIEFDLDEFIKTKLDEYFDNGYFATNIFRLTQIEFLKIGANFGDHVVMGGGEQLFEMTNNVTGLSFVYGFGNSMEYTKKHDIQCNPFFYYSTPELVAAYHDLPIVKWSFTQPTYYNNGAASYATKMIALHSVYPDMLHRRKLNGFEQLSNESKNLSITKMEERCASLKTTFFLPRETLLKQLHP